jgi:hypothetical protein
MPTVSINYKMHWTTIKLITRYFKNVVSALVALISLDNIHFFIIFNSLENLVLLMAYVSQSQNQNTSKLLKNYNNGPTIGMLLARCYLPINGLTS